VPAEAQRLERRLGRRDRLTIATILTVTAIAVAGALFVHDENSNPSSTQCITYDDAGVMGGGTWNLCGSTAVAFCRQHLANGTGLADKCARLRHGANTPTRRAPQHHERHDPPRATPSGDITPARILLEDGAGGPQTL
jgi:hypothetical protein